MVSTLPNGESNRLTMWQTVSARIRGTKTELEELGEDTENVLSSSKLRSLVMGYTDVDIMKSATEYKDIYEIVSEIGKKWKDLKDVERAALLEGLAGKKQSNTLAAVLNNAERLEDIYQTAEKSAGSAYAEQAKYTSSLQYSLDQLTAHGEEFWSTFINKDDVKKFIDLINILISGATKLVDTFGSIPTIASIFGGVSLIKNIGNIKKSLGTVAIAFDSIKNINTSAYIGSDGLFDTDALKSYAAQLSGLTTTQQKMALMTTNLTAAQREQVLTYMAEFAASKTLTAQQLIELSADQKQALVDAGIITAKQARTGATITLTNAELRKIIADEAILAKDKQLILSAFGVTEANFTEASSWEILGKSVEKTLLKLAKNPWTWVIVGVVALTVAYAKLTSTAESAAKAQEKLSEAENNLSSTKDELSGIDEKISEIKSKGGELGISSRAELKRLETERAILKDQLELLELKKELAAEKSNREAVKAVDVGGNKSENWHEDADEIKIYKITGYSSPDRDGTYKKGMKAALSSGYAFVNQNATTIDGYKEQIEEVTNEISEWESKPYDDKAAKKLLSLRSKKQKLQEGLDNSKEELVDIYLRDSELLLQITGDDEASNAARKKLQNEMNFLERIIYTKEQIAKNKFDNFIKDDSNKRISNEFKNIQKDGKVTAQEIMDLAEKFPVLMKFMNENGITAETLAAEFNVVGVETKSLGEQVDQLTGSWEVLNNSLDSIQSAYDTVQSAINEYNQAGYFSVDTFKALLNLSPEYLNMLMDENGNLNLNTEAVHENTAACIENMGIKAAQNLINNVSALRGATAQLDYLTGATIENTGATWDNIYAQIAAAEAVSDPTVIAALKQRVFAIKAMTDSAISGIGKGGLSKDADKQAEQQKKHNLEILKESLEAQENIINRYKKSAELMDFGIELADEHDFSSRADLISNKLNQLTLYGSAMREEFDRVAGIVPKTADEAQALADRLENLGQEMRDNISNLRETQIELQKLKIDAITHLGTDALGALESELEDIERRMEILSGDNENDYQYTNQILSMKALIPTRSDFNKQAAEKRRQNKEIIDVEQETQDTINDIVTKSLEMQADENEKAREKERLALKEDLNKVSIDYNTFLKDFEVSTTDTTTNVAKSFDDMASNIQLAFDKIKTSGYDWQNNVLPGLTPFLNIQQSGRSSKIINTANQYLGTPYVFGGNSLTNGIDCSGFVQQVLKANGVSISRTTETQWNDTSRVKKEELQPGDLVFFKDTYKSGISHVGIYQGQGKFIHASTSKGVTVSDLNDEYFLKHWAGGGRYYAKGTPKGNAIAKNLGIAGENYKPEILVDKTTGKTTYIDEPTVIDVSKTDVVGERATARIPKFATGTPTNDPELLNIVKRVCESIGIPSNVLLSVIDQETGNKWYDGVMDSNGYKSYGYMMINDIHINGLESGYANKVRTDPYTNVLEGAKILVDNFNKLGNWADAASAYNQGLGGFQKNGRNQYGNDVWNRANTNAFINALGNSGNLPTVASTGADKNNIVEYIGLLTNAAIDTVSGYASDARIQRINIENDKNIPEEDKYAKLVSVYKPLATQGAKIGADAYAELVNLFVGWYNQTKENPELWSQEVFDLFNESLDSIEENVRNLEKNAEDFVHSAVDKRWSISEDWINDRNTYNDWALFDDNEVAAWERVVKWLNKDYPDQIDKIKEAEKNLFEARKREFEKGNNFANTYLESHKTLLQSHYDVTNAISEAQHEINKELETSKTMYEYLDEDTRKLLFNQEDYNTLYKELSIIQNKANNLQKQYEADLSGATLETIESITSNYQMQYETLMKSYEIAKADLEIIKKKAKLNNVLNERNVRMFVNGSWQWVANTEDVSNARSELADAEYAKQVEEAGLTQQTSINNLTQQQDALSVIMKKFENGIIGLNEAVGSTAKTMSNMPSALFQMLVSATPDTKAYSQGATSGSYNGIWFDGGTDYMDAILNATNKADVAEYNEIRNAKILGNNLGEQTMSNAEAIEKWEEAQWLKNSKVMPITALDLWGDNNGKLMFDTSQMQAVGGLWNTSAFNIGNSGLTGAIQPQQIDQSQDNRIIINGMTVDDGSLAGKDLIDALRRYVGNH